MKDKIEKLIPDTSVIIEGIISKQIKEKKISVNKIIIHEAVLSELEHQANLGKAIGFIGLDEIKKLRELSNNYELTFSGQKPRASEIKYASLGEVDFLIRTLAYDEDATLMTSDKIQASIADAKGMRCILVKVEDKKSILKLDKFFDENTMSVHLREGIAPYAKKGIPGRWEFVNLRKKELSQDEIQNISREIIEQTKIRKDGFIEIEREGSTIIQLGTYRIVITKPPFSDGWEITAVRPIKQLKIDDYKLSEKLKNRIADQAEGILVAGSPGMGKSTFAQALGVYYASKEKTVKTVEAPRDLILPESITQYSISHGDAQEIHDVLLLSRPDYTIFDEMRNTNDFRLFADMRLSGVGMVGIVHATSPVDAIQRFIGRIELGVIPQVIDTVIFIKNGTINKIYQVVMTVKVPSGMTEADLARPIVEVSDFETNSLEFEIYSYGEETVVIPTKGTDSKTPTQKIAQESILKELKKLTDNVEVEVISDNRCRIFIPERMIPKIIGKQGKNIEQLEKKIGISIDVQPIGENNHESNEEKHDGQTIKFESEISKRSIKIMLDSSLQKKDCDIYVNGEYLMSANISKTGQIKINKKSKIGKILVDGLNTNKVKILV